MAWVTLDTPPAERDDRLAELGKVFDVATAVFVVDTWRSGSSYDLNRDFNWSHHFPSLGPTPRLPDKELFIGRDAMNIGKPNEIMVFSARGAEAVHAVLALEHLGAASTTTTDLDAHSTLFRCTHRSAPEADFMYTWRGCV